MTYDYTRLATKITVNTDKERVIRYNGFTSMYNCLSECGESFTGMSFSRRMWIVSEVLNQIHKPKPDPVLTAGRLFIYTFTATDIEDDYRVTVIDSLDNSILIDEYYKNLQLANVMDSVTDINGLYNFLVSTGELLPSDQIIMTNDQLTGFDPDELQP